MADQKTESYSTLPPIWKQPPENAIHVDVCRNGDANFRQTVVLNKKRQPTFDSWLEHLSTRMNLRCGAVWRVFTPTHGHRIRDYESLHDGNVVVVAGQERFKPCRYKDIDISPKRSRSKQAEELPDTSRKFQVSARHKKINTQATAIKCWLNGKGTLGPKIILLSPHRNRPKTVDEVVECVSCVMEECCWGVVDKLYQLNGIRVLAMDQIVQNGNYFAVLRKRPMVKDTYREASLPAFICSPQSRRRLPPLPGSNKTSSHSSPEHSVTSRNGSENHSDSQRSHNRPYRRERQHAREDKDSVVMAHPVKVKRKQQQQQQQPNYDQDKGGVFKAKNENRATRGARPVEDSAYTRTELPLDQRVAEPVLDEDLDRYSAHDDFSDESDQAPHTQQQEQERTYRTNARRAHSPASEESRREKERQARQRREEEDRARAERQQQQQEAIRRRKKEKEEQQRKKQQQEEKEEQEKEKEEKERRRRAEKERERDEERRRRAKKEKEEEEEERRRRKMEEEEKKKKRKEEEPRKATPRTPTPDKSRDTPQRADTSTLPNSQDSHAQQQEEEWAATKIQAGFRGYRERRDLKQRDARNGQDSRQSQDEPIPFLEDDEDLDLGPGPNDDNNNDHDHQHHRDHDDRLEQEKAATKIQAGFRGAKARKEVEAMRGEREAREEQERAATKIQAGFRGAKARREVEVMRAEKEM